MRYCSIVTIFVVLSFPVLASAQSVSTQSRTSVFQSQLNVIDGRLSGQYSNSVRLKPNSTEITDQFGGIPSYYGEYTGAYLNMARTAARQYGVPENLFLRMVQQESDWNPSAVSPKGAIGLAQLMPQTARLLGVNPIDPRQNLDGGARYLKQQFDTFGDWRLALAAYNAGPGAVKKHRGIPPYEETLHYVRMIYGS